MNYSNYRFTLDMQSNISQVSLPVRLLDTSRKLYISLTDGGSPYTIADGCRAVFYARKADGKTIMNDCIIEKNTTIRYDLTQQTTTCAGIVDCEVRLYGADGNLITSPRFILVVDERVVYDDDFPLSESEKSAFDNIVSSELGRVNAEDLRVAAETKRESAENYRVYRESERFLAETERELAESKRAEATSKAINKVNDLLEVVQKGSAPFTVVGGDVENNEAAAVGATAFGYGGTKAKGIGAFVAGNLDTGTYPDGTRVIKGIVYDIGATGKASASIGGSNTAAGEGSVSFGAHCASLAKRSFTAGQQSWVYPEHEDSIAIGKGVQSGAKWQTIFGSFNNPNSTAVFQIGAGTSGSNRVNAFEVGIENNETYIEIGGTRLTLSEIIALKALLGN